ncbi:bumetanide-sensitive sodium-(potassium)-chloride cotransporter-like [Macrobrachium nipponense]|uniref:bumetanide-sensitive sodium-(potassium)-chloride cotransporter-like n=1 Tax=Macrobrachium nipponense TaxID=159736 RepID=UPI0030C86EFC
MSSPDNSKFSVTRVDVDDPAFTADDSVTPRGRPPSIDLNDPSLKRGSNQFTPLGDDRQHRGSITYSTFLSLRRMTREALPNLDHYRNLSSIVNGSGPYSQRPTLDDLHQPGVDKDRLVKEKPGHGGGQADLSDKFGWIRGVFIRCLLNIWGVILFLRLSWVTGQCGIIQAILVATCGNLVTCITALSMSAISTNGIIKGGGTYYMISRSLGPEFGGAIGLVFSLANAVNAAMHTVGFCESMNDLLKSQGVQIVDGSVNDIRIVGAITLICLTAICIIGMAWENRAQLVLLVVLIVAILDFIIGAFIGPMSDEEIAKGFVGLNGTVFMDNLYSDYRKDDVGLQQSFFVVFSVFFPACTGIMAGANISGDLKDPSSAIPKGTLLAIAVSYSSYLVFILLSGAGVVRDATGDVSQVANWTFTNCTDIECDYGLQNNNQVMELMSVFGPLIYAGCFAATLSSALASLVSAPRIFQALCKDKLYPGIEFFGKGYGSSDQPYRGYVLTFIISLIFLLIGRLDSIAPIITNFFLASYALINLSTFHASLQKGPGWRPTFRYYNKWLSLAGALLCTSIMFLIQWWTALLTFIIILLLYVVVQYRKPEVNWGSSTQAQTYKLALNSVTSLSHIEEHVKTYRPQILVLSGMPSSRPPLLHFANAITKKMSLLIAGQCFPVQQSYRVKQQLVHEATTWLDNNKIKAFYACADGPSMDMAARSLMTNAGIGKLHANTVLMGFKADWSTCSSGDLDAYFKTIHYAFDLHLAVGILKVEGGLDYSSIVDSLPAKIKQIKSSVSTSPDGPQKYQNYSNEVSLDDENPGLGQQPKKEENKDATPKSIDAMLRFNVKQPKGTIDVWWLFDDGGLTLLLPYILTTRAHWSECSLRIFCLANNKDDLASEQLRMTELLCKFRIDFSDVIMIPDIQKKPKEESQNEFNNLINKFKVDEEQNGATGIECITEAELIALREKTNRHIRLRELLLQHSRKATMVVMTLPIPVVGTVSAPLYMAWLETLTKDMPPFLLIRGNQSSVLTFYS